MSQMTKCPKCNCTKIAGPHYQKSAFGYECLRYRCERCGYCEDHPTADHEGWLPSRLRHGAISSK